MRLALAGGLIGLMATGAVAGQGGDLARQHLYAGTPAAGIKVLTPLADAGDAEARFGIGLLLFASALQDFTGTLLGYGMITPNPAHFEPLGTRRDGIEPAALSYAALREVLQAFASDLDTARDVLVQAADMGGDWVVPVDLARVRLDLDGDGAGSEAESLAALGAALAGEVRAGPIPLEVPNIIPDVAPERPRGVAGGALGQPVAGIGFDRADGYWLAGYTQVVASQVDFLLAHDFEDTFNAVGHRLFNSPALPMSPFAEGASLFMDPSTDAAIADLIAAIHTISWPVIEPERLAGIADRLHAITSLSRRNWQAVLAETDDVMELVPSPRQTALDPDARVTDEMVVVWHETLDIVDRIIDGELLLPHWRFQQGVDLKAFLTGATRTDMVMLLSGLDMLPFLAEGPKADAEAFAGANRVFGNDIWSYVFWFN